MTLHCQSKESLFPVLYALMQLGAQAQTQAGKSVEQALTEAALSRALKSVSEPSANAQELTPCQDRMRYLRSSVVEIELPEEQGALLMVYLDRALPLVQPLFIERAAEVYEWVKASQ